MNISFNKYFGFASLISTGLFIISILFLIFKGLNFGVDFKGGTLIELRVNEPNISISNIRDNFKKMNLKGLTVKEFGNETDFIIKFQSLGNNKNLIQDIKNKLEKKDVNLADSINDYKRLIQLNKHIDQLFKTKVKEISLSTKKIKND